MANHLFLNRVPSAACFFKLTLSICGGGIYYQSFKSCCQSITAFGIVFLLRLVAAPIFFVTPILLLQYLNWWPVSADNFAVFLKSRGHGLILLSETQSRQGRLWLLRSQSSNDSLIVFSPPI
jgi:hypothetical protein